MSSVAAALEGLGPCAVQLHVLTAHAGTAQNDTAWPGLGQFEQNAVF